VGVSEVVDVRRAGCRHIQDAGTRQQVLQTHTGDALFGPLGLAAAERIELVEDTRRVGWRGIGLQMCSQPQQLRKFDCDMELGLAPEGVRIAAAEYSGQNRTDPEA
jgi:hypothetical protein